VSDSGSHNTSEDENVSSRTSIQSGDELEGALCKTYLKVKGQMLLRSTVLNVVVDNPDNATEVISAVIGN
jgi:hypothetical protein